MNPTIVDTVFRKEILDMLREKRTLVAMLGIPLLLYPVLFIFGSQATMLHQDRVAASDSNVVIEADDPERIRAWLEEIDQISVVEADGEPDTLLADSEIDAIVRAEESVAKALESGTTLDIVVLYDATEGSSREAGFRLRDGLQKKQDELLSTRLQAIGIEKEYVTPLRVERKNVASSGKTTGTILGMLIPLVMIVMLGVGAFYPAIDLTAGEKERGTFETLLSTPIRTTEIVTGKFFAVFCLAILTGLLNLGSMMLTFTFQLSQIIDEVGAFQLHIPFSNVMLMVVVMVPLAFLISAAMMSVAVFARSFREAQNYVTPFFALLIFPAAYAVVPGAELNAATQFLPIANVSLLFKELMTDRAAGQDIFVVFASTLIYAIIALTVAASIFKREELILSDQGGVSLTFSRDGMRRRSLPTPGMALFLLALCMLLVFYIGTYAQGKNPFVGVLITQWGIFLLPTLVFLWYVRVDIPETLSLRAPRLESFAGVLLVAVGWTVIALQIALLQNRFFPMPPEYIEAMKDLLQFDRISLPILIGLFALSPAICEETLFRGAVLSGLRARLPLWALVIVVGLLFGVAHMSVYKLPAVALSGALFTYLVYRSGSIFTSMTAHFLINGASLMLERKLLFPDAFIDAVSHAEETGTMIPLTWTIGAAVLLAAGLLLIEWSGRKHPAVPMAEVDQNPFAGT